MQEYEVSVRVSNSRDATITFVLEPWGEIYAMESHVTFLLHLRSSIQGSIEIDYGCDRITIYAWEDCVASLFKDEKELGAGASSRTHVPKIP